MNERNELENIFSELILNESQINEEEKEKEKERVIDVDKMKKVNDEMKHDIDECEPNNKRHQLNENDDPITEENNKNNNNNTLLLVNQDGEANINNSLSITQIIHY